MTVATSTVAMTVYNLLAGGTGARTIDEIAAAVSGWAAESRIVVSESQLREAVAGLVVRGFVRDMGARGLFDVVDPKRRVVASRDRTGEGWAGWRVHTMARLEDVIK